MRKNYILILLWSTKFPSSRGNIHLTENDLYRLQIDVEMTKPQQIEDLLGSPNYQYLTWTYST